MPGSALACIQCAPSLAVMGLVISAVAAMLHTIGKLGLAQSQADGRWGQSAAGQMTLSLPDLVAVEAGASWADGSAAAGLLAAPCCNEGPLAQAVPSGSACWFARSTEASSGPGLTSAAAVALVPSRPGMPPATAGPGKSGGLPSACVSPVGDC